MTIIECMYPFLGKNCRKSYPLFLSSAVLSQVLSLLEDAKNGRVGSYTPPSVPVPSSPLSPPSATALFAISIVRPDFAAACCVLVFLWSSTDNVQLPPSFNTVWLCSLHSHLRRHTRHIQKAHQPGRPPLLFFTNRYWHEALGACRGQASVLWLDHTLFAV